MVFLEDFNDILRVFRSFIEQDIAAGECEFAMIGDIRFLADSTDGQAGSQQRAVRRRILENRGQGKLRAPL